MAEVKVPQIYGLIGKAIGMIGAIGKDAEAKNLSGKTMYKFRGIDDVYNALNPVMAELGIFIVPEVLDQKREERLSVNKSTLIYSIVTVKFTMFAPDGSSVSGITIGEGMDSGDKATNKAMSIAMKYFCFEVFCIPTEEMKDPDAEVHEVLPRTAQKPVEEVKKDVPAQVVKQNVLPAAKPVNKVFEYIKNEQKFMAERLELSQTETKVWFAEKRKALIQSGVVKDIAPVDLTMAQAKQLVDAIYKTFMSDGEAS